MEQRRQLRMLGKTLAAAEQKARRAREAVNEAILAAYRDGMTMTDISRDTEISRETIRKVIQRAETTGR